MNAQYWAMSDVGTCKNGTGAGSKVPPRQTRRLSTQGVPLRDLCCRPSGSVS